jgi:soluble lytic murein transglycosylase-like protein
MPAHQTNLPPALSTQSIAKFAVDFFARVIWQESRFDARAISPSGAAGKAQFMPATASWYGFADPFDPIESLRHSAAYLRDLLNRFGNLGLAAAAYNAGPTRVSAWLTSDRSRRADGAHLAAAFGAKRIVCAERGVGLELGIVGTRHAVEMRRFL